MKNKIKIWLLVLAMALWGCVFLLKATAYNEKTPYYNQQVLAAQNMNSCMEAIGEYKRNLNIQQSPYELFNGWMLGESFNSMTTTLGDLSAKRTTANPNMAALMVKMLVEAGLNKGDKVALGFSGSFPAMNIAALTAAEAMELDVVIISSVGASTYGANNPELSFVEMLDMLYCSGLVNHNSQLVTAGGDYDTGANMGEEFLTATINRIKQRGLPFYSNFNLAETLEKKINVLGDANCFVAVGGNISFAGYGVEQLTGVIKPNSVTKINPKDGIIEYYLVSGKNAINIINIKKLTANYGMVFDPVELWEIGYGNIYYQTSYYNSIAWAALIFAVFIAYRILLLRKKG